VLDLAVLKALGNEKRLAVLHWLADPVADPALYPITETAA
jgi:DNA-binding transcriptional ArsR family regulator